MWFLLNLIPKVPTDKLFASGFMLHTGYKTLPKSMAMRILISGGTIESKTVRDQMLVLDIDINGVCLKLVTTSPVDVPAPLGVMPSAVTVLAIKSGHVLTRFALEEFNYVFNNQSFSNGSHAISCEILGHYESYWKFINFHSIFWYH